MLVCPPPNLHVSDVQTEFFVGGRQLTDDYPSLKVYLDGLDVTGHVGWTWLDETRVDVNGDGWLESLVATAVLDLSGMALGHDSVLELEATTQGALGSQVTSRSGRRVLGHAEVGMAPSRIPLADPPESLTCFLAMYGVPGFGVSRVITIEKDGLDITSSAVFTERAFGSVLLPTGKVDSRSELVLNTLSLGELEEGTVIVVTMDVNIPGLGTFSSSAGLSVGAGIGQIPCAEDEICQFLGDMGITRAPTGELSVGSTDKDLMRAAAEDLKDGLRACQTAAEQGQQDIFSEQVDCDGVVIDVVLVIGGNSDSWAEPTFAGGASVENSLVVAIGGDGTGNGTGGATTEARAGKGSVAIAIGGTGSDKAYGGRASALAAEEKSTGIALGGRGGEGGGQGGGSFTDCENADGGIGGQGISGGGPGGHSGPSSVGGHGGGAGVRSNEGDYSNREGGPKEGGAGDQGKHGSGACAQADAEGNASAEKGSSVDN